MPYACGEEPMIGDRIQDKQGRPGKVTDLQESRIRVRWDKGVVAIEYAPEGFSLVGRISDLGSYSNRSVLPM